MRCTLCVYSAYIGQERPVLAGTDSILNSFALRLNAIAAQQAIGSASRELSAWHCLIEPDRLQRQKSGGSTRYIYIEAALQHTLILTTTGASAAASRAPLVRFGLLRRHHYYW